MQKSVFLFLSFVFLAATSHAQPVAPTQKATEKGSSLTQGVLDQIICIVGDKAILASDVEDQFQQMQQQRNMKLPEEARCEILDQNIMSEIMVAQAKLDSMKVGEDEIEQELNARIDQILGYMNGDAKQFEQYYGMGIPEVKEKFREDLTNQKLGQQMQRKIMESVTVTPSEVKDFFGRIPQDSLPYFNAEVEIAQVVLKPKVSEAANKAAYEQLAQLRKQLLEKSADFASLAQKYSADKGSAKAGGDLGWVKRGQFVAEFEAAAFKLNRNEYSSIVKSQFGYHLIQLLERRGNSIHTRHILIKPELTKADYEAVRIRLDSIRTAIYTPTKRDKATGYRTDSLTFEMAVQRFSQDDLSKSNGGAMTNPQTGSAYFETGDLQPEVYFAIDSLQEGGITAPLEMQEPSGDASYKLLQLRSRSEPHQASVETDYNKIKSAALEQKKAIAMNTWMVEHVGKIFIKVNEPYTVCPNLKKWTEKRSE